MKPTHLGFAAALLLAFPLAGGAADPAIVTAEVALSPERQVEALFAKWNKPDVPGAEVVVIRDGKVVLSKAYGMADLERAVPITTETVFNIGSISKQFTAFAIQLLAADGKLALTTTCANICRSGQTLNIRLRSAICCTTPAACAIRRTCSILPAGVTMTRRPRMTF